MNPRRWTLLAAVAGTLVGVLVIVVVVRNDGGHRAARGPEVVAEFLQAYRRSREATYSVEAQFTRTMPDGSELTSAASVVQRPPDEIRRQLGSVTGQLQGRKLNCSTGPDGSFRCLPGAEAQAWGQTVDQDVSTMASYFDPSATLYVLYRVDSSCYELDLVADVADAPYGTWSVMCFDEATGSMSRLELHHQSGAVDRFEAQSSRSAVDPAELTVDNNPAYDAKQVPAGGEGTSSTSTPS